LFASIKANRARARDAKPEGLLSAVRGEAAGCRGDMGKGSRTPHGISEGEKTTRGAAGGLCWTLASLVLLVGTLSCGGTSPPVVAERLAPPPSEAVEEDRGDLDDPEEAPDGGPPAFDSGWGGVEFSTHGGNPIEVLDREGERRAVDTSKVASPPGGLPR